MVIADGKDSRSVPLHVAAIGLLALGIAVFVLLFTISSRRSLNEAYGFAQETISFLEDTVDRYENVDIGETAKSLESLTDAAHAFSRFLSPEKIAIDDQMAEDFIRTERIRGFIALDDRLAPIAQADLDSRDAYTLWKEVIDRSSVKSVLSAVNEAYSDTVTLNGSGYIFSVVPYGNGLLLVYESAEAASPDRYDISISDILTNDSFHENPVIIMTDGSSVVSTNDPTVNDLVRRKLDRSAKRWTTGQLNEVPYGGMTHYGCRVSYKTYRFYVLYAADEIFDDRAGFVAAGLVLFLAVCIALVTARSVADRRRLHDTQKQLSIIDAISATYETTFLLHLDHLSMEAIRMSAEVTDAFRAHPDPADFLLRACNSIVAPGSRGAVLALMDAETLEQRLENRAFLAEDIETVRGTWYSLQVIPQRRDEKGHLLSVLVATRSIMALKRAEELSFRDRLTGLRNRNYLESHLDSLTSETAMPLSLIMADADHLKHVNDSLGHERGDELLQRIADVLRKTVGPECTTLRIGGDEFLILCPRTSAAMARVLMSDIEQNLAAASDDDLMLGVSLGSAIINSASESFKDAFKDADAAMYTKKSGHRRA